MKTKLIKFALIAFFAFLPLPFIAKSSYLFAGFYVVVATMISGASLRFFCRDNNPLELSGYFYCPHCFKEIRKDDENCFKCGGIIKNAS